MARMLGPKHKRCRRLGERVCGNVKCPLTKRNYAPGMHGPKGKPRLTGYGMQLREKQKAKAIYGVLERQFRTYYERAKAKRGKTGELMLIGLERRLDNIAYRAGFAGTRRQARQLVSHAQFQVNGKSVNIPSYQVKAGDIVTVKTGKAKNAYWTEIAKNTTTNGEVPAWMVVDKNNLKVTITQLPSTEMIQSDLQMHLIIELYSL
ncbi:MAG: 30S ribosomal protein S4 [Candidatus Kerfeldbacteria bacterium]|nr:30S ribosomal protein S4 [Candidatus Kerfeldbacteria bacterium]